MRYRDKFFYNLWHIDNKADIAQLVEHLICNQGVPGSNPGAGTIIIKDLAGNGSVRLKRLLTTSSLNPTFPR